MGVGCKQGKKVTGDELSVRKVSTSRGSKARACIVLVSLDKYHLLFSADNTDPTSWSYFLSTIAIASRLR